MCTQVLPAGLGSRQPMARFLGKSCCRGGSCFPKAFSLAWWPRHFITSFWILKAQSYKAMSEPCSEPHSRLSLPWGQREKKSRWEHLHNWRLLNCPASQSWWFGGLQSMGMDWLENQPMTRLNTLDGTLPMNFRYNRQGCPLRWWVPKLIALISLVPLNGKG